jgi:predicted dehydrogenase
MDTIRFAVAGTGSIIREFHLPALLANPQADVLAAANLHPSSLQTMVSELRIPRSYDSFDELANDTEVDAVVIGLPNYLNAPVAIKMLRAGKHVLCEKPMARNVDEAEHMIEAAERSGKTLMIGHVWRSNEEMRWLRDTINSGALGDILKCKAHAVPRNWGPPAGSWRVKANLSGGGAFADVGIHAVDSLAFLFKDQVRPTKVFAVTGNFFQKLEVEDTANVLLEYENRMTGWIEAGWYHNFAASPHGAIEVFGTKGFARLFPTELHCGLEGQGSPCRPFGPMNQSHIDLRMYAAQINEFIACVLTGRAPICDGRCGLETIKIMEGVYKSAVEGRAITLPCEPR